MTECCAPAATDSADLVLQICEFLVKADGHGAQ